MAFAQGGGLARSGNETHSFSTKQIDVKPATRNLLMENCLPLQPCRIITPNRPKAIASFRTMAFQVHAREPQQATRQWQFRLCGYLRSPPDTSLWLNSWEPMRPNRHSSR